MLGKQRLKVSDLEKDLEKQGFQRDLVCRSSGDLIARLTYLYSSQSVMDMPLEEYKQLTRERQEELLEKRLIGERENENPNPNYYLTGNSTFKVEQIAISEAVKDVFVYETPMEDEKGTRSYVIYIRPRTDFDRVKAMDIVRKRYSVS